MIAQIKRSEAAQMTARFLTCVLTTATLGALILMPRISQGEEPNARPVANDLAQYLERARREFNAPGLAVGIVKDGRVIFEQGFGERSLQDHRPVSARTLFCIASNTKSVTGTALEILADEGKLHLEDRVVDHLPWFRMGDPYVTREMRLRDILAHRSGLGSHAGDLLFVTPSTYTTREVVERLRNVPLASGFRATFAYENLMYAVAALVIEQASGESYADFVREHIFRPVGMNESHIDATELKPTDDLATAYALRDGKLTALPPLVWKNNPGAAGIYSTVHDMTKWAEAQLAVSSTSAQHPLLSSASQQRMWSMITPIDIDPAPIPELQPAQPNFLGYAEGWYVSDYAGQRLVWHTGEFPGMLSRVTLVPALNLGVVVLINQEADGVRDAITFHVLDTYLGSQARIGSPPMPRRSRSNHGVWPKRSEINRCHLPTPHRPNRCRATQESTATRGTEMSRCQSSTASYASDSRRLHACRERCCLGGPIRFWHGGTIACSMRMRGFGSRPTRAGASAAPPCSALHPKLLTPSITRICTWSAATGETSKLPVRSCTNGECPS